MSMMPLIALERKPPDTGALLGGASSRKMEELRSKVEKLESDIARVTKRIASIDSTVTLANYRNVANMATQQAEMSSELKVLSFKVNNNRADKGQFFLAVRVIMSHLLLGLRPMDVSFEDESLLRELNIHHTFGLTRGSNGKLNTPRETIQAYKMMKPSATETDRKQTFYEGWGSKDSSVQGRR